METGENLSCVLVDVSEGVSVSKVFHENNFEKVGGSAIIKQDSDVEIIKHLETCDCAEGVDGSVNEEFVGNNDSYSCEKATNEIDECCRDDEFQMIANLTIPEVNNFNHELKSVEIKNSSSIENELLKEQCVQPFNTIKLSEGQSVDTTTTFPTYLFDTQNIYLICRACKEFKRNWKNSFLKGCKWSPDGSCLLTNSDDNKLSVFDLPQELYTLKTWPKNQVNLLPDLKKTVHVEEGGRVYDYCWYPQMNSWDPPSCCFVSSATNEPVHLWDAFDGQLRATYQSRNYADEPICPFSVNFSPDGEKLFCGFKNRVDIFNVMYPGIKPVTFNIKALTDQSGLVSTVAVNPAFQDLFAVGTFQKSIGLYSVADKCGICVLNGHSGGVTHLLFSPDGSRLYSGSRMDPEIVCWDLRNPGKVLFSMSRNVTTNQRIYFDLTSDGKFLVSGNTNGNVSVWNLENDNILNGDVEPVDPDFVFQAHKDCNNGVSINKQYTILATSSGQRHFPDLLNDCPDEEVEDENNTGKIFDYNSSIAKIENCVKLWWIGPVS